MNRNAGPGKLATRSRFPRLRYCKSLAFTRVPVFPAYGFARYDERLPIGREPARGPRTAYRVG